MEFPTINTQIKWRQVSGFRVNGSLNLEEKNVMNKIRARVREKEAAIESESEFSAIIYKIFTYVMNALNWG